MDASATPEDLRNRRNLFLIAGGILAIVIIGFVVSNRDDGGTTRSGPPTNSPSTTPTTSAPGPSAAQPDSEVPPIDCNDLLTFTEVNDALGVDDNPALDGGSGILSLNEECTHTMNADERYFVQISPSGPSDFEPTARLLDVAAVPVDGVGVRAVWFGGVDSDSGVLAVEEASEHGRLFVRIFVGRPDVDDAERREIATGLAALALTRFPGVAIEVEAPPEPEVVVFEDEDPPDTADRSLGDNLLAREAAGDWTRAEGLIASLRYVAGEVDAAEVLSTPELSEPSATLVVLLARDYLENGPAGEDATEIERLLDIITRFRPDGPVADGRAAIAQPLAWAFALAQEDPGDVDLCADAPLTETCASEIELGPRSGVPDGKYGLFVDARGGADWSSDFVSAARDAVLDAAGKYEPLGTMPATDVVLHQQSELRYTQTRSESCVVFISDEVVASFDPDRRFQQLIAREMAFCLIGVEFREILLADLVGSRWWTQGLATYLSGVVYPNANTEHSTLPRQLAAEELATTIEDRGWTNWALFEYLHATIGVEGNLANISGFPVGGDHAEALAAYPDMAELFHGFELALTDADLDDIGNGRVPYEPRDWDLPIVAPVTAELAVPRFGVRRIAITVPEGQQACFEIDESDNADVSWRPGVAGETGQWDTERPESLVGDSMLVITTVDELARFELTVTRLTSEDDCTQEAPSSTTLGVCDIGCGPSRYYYP